ncbi:flagellar hook-length control protein FliK, partial [bacterium]|nr:flagellar hook-length control protein FliK [bacterium]
NNISLHTHRLEEPSPQSTILSETKTSTTPPTIHPLSKAIHQIVENAEIHRQKEGIEMEIFLKPEFLGKLNMKLNLTEGVLDVRFTVGTRHLKELMEQNLQNLRHTFNSLEVAVGEIGVSVDNGSTNQGNLWSKTYNENTHDSARYSFEPAELLETPQDDRATRLYWRQASFEFTA